MSNFSVLSSPQPQNVPVFDFKTSDPKTIVEMFVLKNLVLAL